MKITKTAAGTTYLNEDGSGTFFPVAGPVTYIYPQAKGPTRRWGNLCAGDWFIYSGNRYAMTDRDERGYVDVINLDTGVAGSFCFSWHLMNDDRVELITY